MPDSVESDEAVLEAAMRDFRSRGPDPEQRQGYDTDFEDWVALRVAAVRTLGRLDNPRALDVLAGFVQGLRLTSSEFRGFDRVGAAAVRALSNHHSADRAAMVMVSQLVDVCEEEERRRGEIEKARQQARLFSTTADQQRKLEADVARERRRRVEPLEQARRELIDGLVQLGPVARVRLEAVASGGGGLAKTAAAEALRAIVDLGGAIR